jgi:hypothetical protein
MTRATLGILVRALLVSGLLPALSACSKSRPPSVGGETNWLVRCSDDNACELGSCLCGLCTRECEKHTECTGDFEGACAGRDEAGAALACGSNASPAAVCLPRCSSDDACGERYLCDLGVCIPALPGGGGPPDAGSGGLDGRVIGVIGTPFPDGGPSEGGSCNPFFPDATVCDLPTVMNIAPLLDELAQSEAAWNALSAEGGDTYWYEEENCAINVVGGGGEATIVQVEDGVARVLDTRAISSCVTTVNRYGALLKTNTMPELYELCRNLLRFGDSEVTLRTGDDGVIASCFSTDAPDCFDACGSGFALTGWGFGHPGQDAGTP